MFSVRIGAGRLIEIRISSPLELADVKPLQDLIRKTILSLQGKAVSCADVRQGSVLTQDVVEGVIELMRGDNPNVERVGILLSTSAVSSMQMERIVRNANNPNRRAFRDPKECVAWLSEVLNPEERAALLRFVAS